MPSDDKLTAAERLRRELQAGLSLREGSLDSPDRETGRETGAEGEGIPLSADPQIARQLGRMEGALEDRATRAEVEATKTWALTRTVAFVIALMTTIGVMVGGIGGLIRALTMGD